MPGRLGHLVLVVGPSGAGKDSVINAVKKRFTGDPKFIFPRRVVTRNVVVATEDHDSLTELAFAEAVNNKAFALWWHAHNNSYGIPASIEDDLRSGHTVIFNCSRDIIAEAAERFLKLTVVEITAPREVLVERIVARGRETREHAMLRVSREVRPFPPQVAVVRIENTGPLHDAVEQICNIIAPKFQRVANVNK